MPTPITDKIRSIPGWGADLDPRNRPAVPKEKAPPNGTGAHWDEPEKQVPTVEILMSTEHRSLTATFGTSCPPRGLSGVIRRYAYRLSEGQKLHWLLLLVADRVDVFEGMLESLLSGNIHNPLAEMGLKSELRRKGGFTSRFGQNRNDVRRQKRELVVLLGLTAGLLATRASRSPGKAA